MSFARPSFRSSEKTALKHHDYDQRKTQDRTRQQQRSAVPREPGNQREVRRIHQSEPKRFRWTAEGTDGCIARVNFSAPSLKSKMEGEGKAIEKIKQLAEAVFTRLFIPTISFKPVENFREEAKALLAKADATKLINSARPKALPA